MQHDFPSTPIKIVNIYYDLNEYKLSLFVKVNSATYRIIDNKCSFFKCDELFDKLSSFEISIMMQIIPHFDSSVVAERLKYLPIPTQKLVSQIHDDYYKLVKLIEVEKIDFQHKFQCRIFKKVLKKYLATKEIYVKIESFNFAIENDRILKLYLRFTCQYEIIEINLNEIIVSILRHIRGPCYMKPSGKTTITRYHPYTKSVHANGKKTKVLIEGYVEYCVYI